jgi:hypothetical protein
MDKELLIADHFAGITRSDSIIFYRPSALRHSPHEARRTVSHASSFLFSFQLIRGRYT